MGRVLKHRLSLGLILKLIILNSCLLPITQVQALCPANRVIPGEYLIRLNRDVIETFASQGQPDFMANLRSQAAESKFIFKAKPSHGLHYFSESTPVAADLLFVRDHHLDMEKIRIHPSVLSIEPNCIVDPLTVPNDPLYSSQWAHRVIKSESAWNVSTGSQKIVVAISDSGVDYTHPDLKAQMWINTTEQKGIPGVDDDGNGCIDDIYGCDLANNDGDPRPGSTSSSFHGTHVAGIAAAAGNNAVGVAGVAWRARIMAVKGFYDARDGSTLAALVGTIYYAAENGARVLNCSWGSASSPTAAERDAFAYARSKNIVVVVAAGNSSANAAGFSPAGISSVLTVGATNSLDDLSAYSNYGSIIDLVAPGGDSFQLGGLDESILSTYPVNRGSYSGQIGTSMAAPFVSGLAALVLAINPSLTAAQVERILIDSGDPVTVNVRNNPTLTFKYRRINAQKAAMAAQSTAKNIDPCIDPANCPGENTSLGSHSASGFGEAINSGMGGCGKMSSADSASSESLFLLGMMLGLPILLAGFLFRKF